MDLNSQIKSLIPANSSVLVALIPELFKSRYGSPIPLRKRKLTDFLKDANAGFEVFVINNALAVKVGSKGINKTSLLSVKAQPKVKNIGKANEATITNNVKGVKSNVKKPALQCELTRRGNPKLAKASGFGDITKSFSEMKISEREVSNMQLADLVEAENIHTAMVTKLSSFVFAPSYRSDDSAVRGRSLFTNNGNNNSGCGYLGNVESAVGTPDFYDDGYGDGDDYFGIDDATDTTAAAEDSHFYINTSEPFCTVCIGVQGAGKSHTMNVLLENCMLQSVQGDDERAIISTRQPMSGLVLHFDQSQSNVCEAVGLKSSAAELSLFPHLRVQELVILVSPSFYKQRKEFYGAEYRVVPLLFDWASLSALQLRKLMRLTDTDSQLYVSTMLNLLRDYQRDNKIPVFSDFVDNVKLLCNVSGQSAPLTQVSTERLS